MTEEVETVEVPVATLDLVVDLASEARRADDVHIHMGGGARYNAAKRELEATKHLLKEARDA